ncbi:MAG TPA: hypothetical protein VLR29_07640, partial [Flavobacterium sp.]|nr:hypothetical protein [Flavobacterium sp.]
FDKIILAIGDNPDKKPCFPLEKRISWLELLYKDESRIKVIVYSGLTVDFCKQNNAKFILRGLRTSADFVE